VSRGRHTPSPIRGATPPHPRTSSLCVSRTLRNPATPVGACSRASRPFLCYCARARARVARNAFTHVSASLSSNPSRVGTHMRVYAHTHTHTHAAAAAAAADTRYRKAEIDNAGGPPAPYPKTDTRPAVAPGPPRRGRDGALPSSSSDSARSAFSRCRCNK